MAHRKYLDILVLSAFIVALFSRATAAPAQVSISIGAAPVCPYGYYDYAPYSCSPYGYYGPDWFSGGEQAFNHFHANEARDSHGHVGNAGHDGASEHSAGAQRESQGGDHRK